MSSFCKKQWIKKYPCPPKVPIFTSMDYESWASWGINTFNKLYQLITKQITINHSFNVLDFGSSCGRIAIPFHEKCGITIDCCDIDTMAIEYLKQNVDGINAVVNNYLPPSQYQTNSFDIVYSISIFTHLPPEMHMLWIKEIHRIIKKDGIVILTFSGYQDWALKKRGITEDELKEKKVFFKKYDNYSHVELPEGSSYGLTSIDPTYISEKWSKFFSILDMTELDSQNVIVMRK